MGEAIVKNKIMGTLHAFAPYEAGNELAIIKWHTTVVVDINKH
jgi:hypothetical protein